MHDAPTSIVARDEAGHGGMDHGTLTIPEIVYMLVLDEGSGTIRPRAEIVLNTTLKHAKLHELALRGHVVLGPGQVTISDRKMTNHPLLDDMMHFLALPRRPPLAGPRGQRTRRWATTWPR